MVEKNDELTLITIPFSTDYKKGGEVEYENENFNARKREERKRERRVYVGAPSWVGGAEKCDGRHATKNLFPSRPHHTETDVSMKRKRC